MRKVFISHSSQDQKILNEIVESLRKHQLEPWVANTDIRPGSNFAQEITHALKSTDLVLVLLTKNSVASTHVMREVSLSIELNKPIRIVLFEVDSQILEDLPQEWQYLLSSMPLHHVNASEDIFKVIGSDNKKPFPIEPNLVRNVRVLSLVAIAVFVGVVVNFVLSNLFPREASALSLIHETGGFEEVIKPFPSSMDGFELTNEIEIKGYASFRLYSVGQWYVPMYWYENPINMADCEDELWIVRWRASNKIDVVSARANVWDYKLKYVTNGFRDFGDPFVLTDKSKIGRSGYISGIGCELPAFKMQTDGLINLMDIDLELQIWER